MLQTLFSGLGTLVLVLSLSKTKADCNPEDQYITLTSTKKLKTYYTMIIFVNHCKLILSPFDTTDYRKHAKYLQSVVGKIYSIGRIDSFMTEVSII